MLSSLVLGEGLRRHPYMRVDSRAERKKNALCLPGALREPGAPSQPLLAGFLRSFSGLGCSWSASGGDGGSGSSRQSGSGPRRWRSLSRASAGSTCRTLADAAGGAAQGWLLLLQRAAGGGRPTRVPTRGVTSVLKLHSLGVLTRVASGSLCSSSASLLEPPKEKSCVERRGWCVTQSSWGSR